MVLARGLFSFFDPLAVLLLLLLQRVQPVPRLARDGGHALAREARLLARGAEDARLGGLDALPLRLALLREELAVLARLARLARLGSSAS